MNRFFSMFLVLPLTQLGLATSLAATPIVEGGDDALDVYVLSEMEAQGLVGVSLGIVLQGDVIYRGGYGYRDRARRLPVVPTSTRFRWASVSKTLAGTAAGIVWQAGGLSLDEDIHSVYDAYVLPTSYLIGGPGSGEGLAPLSEGSFISTRMLLGHFSGVQHYSNGLAKPTPPLPQRNDPATNTGFEWALSRWIGAPLIAQPGTRYSYSTMGANLAGVVIGAAWEAQAPTGLSPDDAFLALVYERIALVSGAVGLATDQFWDPLEERAEGYVAFSPEQVLPDFDSDISWKAPGGGFASTIQDMALYCDALMGDEILSDSAKSLLWQNQVLSNGSTTGYGLGFDVGSRNGHFRVHHSGEQEGATSRLLFYPEDGLCIVLMSNTQGASGVHSISLSRVANGIEDILRGRMESETPPIQLKE